MQKVTANMTVVRLWKNKECISIQNFSDEVSCKTFTLKTKTSTVLQECGQWQTLILLLLNLVPLVGSVRESIANVTSNINPVHDI